jgi:hypothetical protein
MRPVRRPIGRFVSRAVLATAALVAATGSTNAQYRPGVPVATMLVSGPYVTINGSPAANGVTVRSGDRVATGPGSSAIIDFYAGSRIQLDANTDPDIFGSFTGYVGCWIRVLTGQTYTEGSGQRVCFGSGAEQILSQSAFNLQVGPGGELLTVTEGAATVAGAQPTTVAAGTQVSIASGGRIVSERAVGPGELAQITAWRGRYAFAAPGAPPPPTYPPTQPYPSQPYPSQPYQTQPYPGSGPQPGFPFPTFPVPLPGQGGGGRYQPGSEYPPPNRGGGYSPGQRDPPGDSGTAPSPGYNLLPAPLR